MTRRAAGLWFAAVLAVGLALRLWAFAGVSGEYLADDTRYVAVAQNLAHGYAPSGDAEWFGARVAFLWPVAGVFRLAGAGDVTAVLWPLVASLVSVAAAYLVAWELVGKRRVAVLAAALVAWAPLEVLVATRLRPDAVMPAFIALAVWAALRSRRGRHALRWAALAGVFLGLAWSAREMALVMAPVVVAAAWRPSWRTVAAGVGGFAVVVAASCLALALAGASWAMPLTGTAGASQVRTPWDAFSWDHSYAAWVWRHVGTPEHPALALAAVLAVAAAVLAVTRPRRARLPVAWAVWGYLYLEVLALVNLTPSPRFLTMLSVPVAVAVAIAADRLPGHACLAAPAVALVAAALAAAPVGDRLDRSLDVWRVDRLADHLRAGCRAPILADDHNTFAKLNLYLPSGRIVVPRATDPGFEGRDAAAKAADLPSPDDPAAACMVLVPARPQRGAPSNWGDFRRRVTSLGRREAEGWRAWDDVDGTRVLRR